MENKTERIGIRTTKERLKRMDEKVMQCNLTRNSYIEGLIDRDTGQCENLYTKKTVDAISQLSSDTYNLLEVIKNMDQGYYEHLKPLIDKIEEGAVKLWQSLL